MHLDAEHPEEGPKVETETKRLGQFDVSFADTLFQACPCPRAVGWVPCHSDGNVPRMLTDMARGLFDPRMSNTWDGFHNSHHLGHEL